MDESAQRGPQFARASGEGDAYWYLGSLTVVKASGEETGGAFSVIEQLAPPDWGLPWHVHETVDELVYVLEGGIEFDVGEETYHATAGSTVFLPRRVPHRWQTTARTRKVQVTAPPGLEGLFDRLGEPAERLELPPDPDHTPGSPELAETMREVAPEYGFELLESVGND